MAFGGWTPLPGTSALYCYRPCSDVGMDGFRARAGPRSPGLLAVDLEDLSPNH